MTLNQKASLKILKKLNKQATEKKFVSVAVWNKLKRGKKDE